jgi:hypothetical protein
MAAYNVTQPTGESVEEYLARVEPAGRREDAAVLKQLMDDITGEPPVMWGPTMVGYGRYPYRYASGRAVEWFRVGFAPRKASISLYGLQYPGAKALLDRLGPHKRGVDCVWVGRFSGLDLAVLEQLVRGAWEQPAAGA